MRLSGKALCCLAGLAAAVGAGTAQAGVIPGDIERTTRVKLGAASEVREESDQHGVFDSQVLSLVSLDSAQARQTSDSQGNSWSGSLFAGAQVVSVSPVGSSWSIFQYTFELQEATMVMIDASSSGSTDGFEPEVKLDGPLGNLFTWDVEQLNPRSLNATLLPGVYTFEASIIGVTTRPGAFDSSLLFSAVLDAPVVVPAPAGVASIAGAGMLALGRRRRA